MNYRKAIDNKRKLMETVDTIKSFAKENGAKAKEPASEKTSELKECIQNTTTEIKDAVSDKVKEKMAAEFKKNYPGYAVDYLNGLLVKHFTESEDVFVISDHLGAGATITMSELIQAIGKDMVDAATLYAYTDDVIRKNLFEFLTLYYEKEEQLDISVTMSDMTLSIQLKAPKVEEPVSQDFCECPKEPVTEKSQDKE